MAALLLAIVGLRRQAALGARLGRRERAEPVSAPLGAAALQHVGVVRFNPYHDTGGDYSFAVALLDALGNGVLLTGLYHRERCRVYAKPVRSWESEIGLTEEENQAVQSARDGGRAPA